MHNYLKDNGVLTQRDKEKFYIAFKLIRQTGAEITKNNSDIIKFNIENSKVLNELKTYKTV